MNLLVRGGTVVTPEGARRADIRVAGERIVDVGPDLAPQAGETTVDAGGLHVFPGLVDSHVHFRDPGQTAKEDFGSGSAAAAAGGVTTVLCMPNTTPPLATVEALDEAAARGRALCRVDFGLEALVTPANLDRLEALAAARPISFEVFTGGVPEAIHEHEALVRLFARLAVLGAVVGVTAADHALRQSANTAGRASGRTDPLAFADAYPAEIEVVGITGALWAARKARERAPAGARFRLHLRQVHTAEAVEVLRDVATVYAGITVTSEVSPHHLFLTRERLAALGSAAQMIPPLRAGADNAALLAGLHGGTITSIATDHAPHEPDKKARGAADIWQSPSGVPALETLLPALLTAARGGRLALADIARWAAAAPAAIFRLAGKGRIAPGYDADLALVDVEASGVVEPSTHFTRAKSSPFAGMTLHGRVVRTLRRGETIYSAEDGPSSPGGGRLLTASTGG